MKRKGELCEEITDFHLTDINIAPSQVGAAPASGRQRLGVLTPPLAALPREPGPGLRPWMGRTQYPVWYLGQELEVLAEGRGAGRRPFEGVEGAALNPSSRWRQAGQTEGKPSNT